MKYRFIIMCMLGVCSLCALGVLGAADTHSDGYAQAPQAAGTLQPRLVRIALLPDEDPASILKDNAAFVSYLEKALGCKVELIVPHDYSILIESMRSGRLHLAYFGPASYVICKDKGTHISPFAAKVKHGATTYHSLIIGNRSMVQQLKDVKGQTFGFGDPASTSSHLIPKGELLAESLQPRRDYKQLFLGSHDAVALNVQSGSVAAGGLSQSIFQRLVEQGRIDMKKVSILKTSAAFPQYPWVWRNDLSPSFKARIQKAFIDLKDPKILGALHAEGFAAISDQDYNVIRTLEKKVAPYR